MPNSLKNLVIQRGLFPLPLKAFISYARGDEGSTPKNSEHLDKFKEVMTPLVRNKILSTWDDNMILAGSEWSKAIRGNLQNADIIFMLVNAKFIASAFCMEEEYKNARERYDKGEKILIVPVFISDCPHEEISGGEKGLQMIPKHPTNRKLTPIYPKDADWEELWRKTYEQIVEAIENKFCIKIKYG